MQNPDEMMALAVTAFQHWRTSRAHRVLKTPCTKNTTHIAATGRCVARLLFFIQNNESTQC